VGDELPGSASECQYVSMISVPNVIYGCMGLGGGTEPPTAADIDRAAVAVETALSMGITWFDHADIYASGRAETVFGEVLTRSPGLREQLTLQSKCGIRLASATQPGLYDLRARSIIARAEDSLRRLQTDYLDMFLLHRPDALMRPAEVADAFGQLHRRGLVRAFGVSNMSGAQISSLQAACDQPILVNQLEMSLDHRDWVESGVLLNTPEAAEYSFPHGTIEHCQAHEITLQAWGALARGRFSGAPTSPADEATGRLVRSLAAAKGTTPETIVLWWLRYHPAGIVPIIGTTNPERIVACRDAIERPPEFSHDEWYQLWVQARGKPLP
jgi:predicted oxidoreductase